MGALATLQLWVVVSLLTTTTTTGSAITNSTTTTAKPLQTPLYPADTCNRTTCQLPECRCAGNDVPGGLAPGQVPQMVLLTFDDGVLWGATGNFRHYDLLLPADRGRARNNSNGCRTSATFFVSGDGVDLPLIQKLAERGNEIASHSLSHSQPANWSRETWDREIQGMREILAIAAAQPVHRIAGMRAPYLYLGADDQFSMLARRDFGYDSTIIGGGYHEDPSSHPIWPFTLTHPPSRTAPVPVCDHPTGCPRRSYPELWEVPLLRQYSQTETCSMTDACDLGPSPTKDDVKGYLRRNFDRHYSTNRAPFMVSLHGTWFDRVPGTFQGLQDFLEEVSLLPDVWQVTISQMLDWVQHPLPVSRLGEIPSWQC